MQILLNPALICPADADIAEAKKNQGNFSALLGLDDADDDSANPTSEHRPATQATHQRKNERKMGFSSENRPPASLQKT